MNLEQLKAILWLRWRLSVNQWRKAGAFNFVLMMIFVCSTLTLAALSFFLAIGIGRERDGGQEVDTAAGSVFGDRILQISRTTGALIRATGFKAE